VLENRNPLLEGVRYAWESKHRELIIDAFLRFGFGRFCKSRCDSFFLGLPMQDLEVFLRACEYSIDWLDPPSYHKTYLNDLDEDSSEFREYGPPKQGSFITASIEKAIVLVEPITLPVPLAVRKNFRWNDAVMIAGISPQSTGYCHKS
jgi:hypothetical protein